MGKPVDLPQLGSETTFQSASSIKSHACVRNSPSLRTERNNTETGKNRAKQRRNRKEQNEKEQNNIKTASVERYCY